MANKQSNTIFNWYTYSGSYLNFRVAILLFLSATTIGIAGFMLIENYGFVEAFYMTAITISTVGFGEVHPLSDAGRIFVSVFVLYNIGMYTYVLAAFTSFIVQGEFIKNIHDTMIEKEISKLKDHVIICGYGKHGKEIAQHFMQHELPFLVIEKNLEQVELIQKSDDKILYIHDDATQDQVLIAAGIKQAGALISALPNDSDNVFTVLTARQLNSNLKIISRSLDIQNTGKLKMAGADHVITPEQIGAFYMATLVNKPGAVELFSFISRERVSDIHFDEISHKSISAKYGDCTLEVLQVRKNSGANVIALRKPNNEFVINPVPETRLQPGESLIILGDEKQLAAFREHYL